MREEGAVEGRGEDGKGEGSKEGALVGDEEPVRGEVGGSVGHCFIIAVGGRRENDVSQTRKK